jgi:uncharacterized protein (DUF1778 family)
MPTPLATPRPDIKRERLHVRLDTSSRHKIEQAAHYLNKTPSEFVLSQAVSAAEKVIAAQEHTLVLSEADWARFCDVLAAPPKPARKLVNAARRYAKKGGAFG